MADLQKVMDAIKSMDQRLTGSVNEIKAQNNTILSEFSEIKKKFNDISVSQSKILVDITEIQVQVEQLKQQQIASEIVINGIPDKLLGKNIIVDTLNKILEKIACSPLKYWDYRSIFLMRNKNNTSGFTPVCLQLCSLAHKNLITKNQREKGYVLLQQLDSSVPQADTRKIVIKERLTPYNSNLLKEAHIFKAKYNYKYAWFKDTVLIKKSESSKVQQIFGKNDLLKLGLEDGLEGTSASSSKENK